MALVTGLTLATTGTAHGQAQLPGSLASVHRGVSPAALPVPVPLTPDTTPPALGRAGHAVNGCVAGGSFGWIMARKDIRLNVRLTVLGGVLSRAGFRLTSAGQLVATAVSRRRTTSGPASGTIGATLVNGHVYGWRARERAGSLTSAWSTRCRFAIDTSAPTLLAVTSSDFPPAGSTPSGVAGSLTLSATDLVPGGCAPASCSASGVARFEYSLDSKIPAGGITTTTATAGVVTAGPAQPGQPATATVPSLTAPVWGAHTLYVQAIDHAGNRSTQHRYRFFVPMNLAGIITPPLPGDLTGDSVPDLLAVTSAGGLDLYPGSTSSQSLPSPANATGNLGSPDSGNDWNTFQITHRSSAFQGPVDDLYARKGSVMYAYLNDPLNPGVAPQFASGQDVVIISKPSCSATADNSANCATYVTDWTDVTQVLAVGDPFPAVGIDDPASLVTVENDQLWFYPGTQGPQFSSPVLLGSSGWSGETLIAPGYLDGKITIWARDDATGTLYSYPITLDANGLPTLDPAKPGTPVTATSGAVVPGLSLPAASYPVLASPGDARVPAGLYAIDSSGTVWLFTGTSNAARPLAITPGNIGSVTAGSVQQLS